MLIASTLGDFTAVALGIGYLPSIALFAALILVPAVGYRYLRFDGVFAFWFAYVLTRPLGASVADWLGKPQVDGGVGVGSGGVSLGFALVLVALVAVMQARTRRPVGGVEAVPRG